MPETSRSTRRAIRRTACRPTSTPAPTPDCGNRFELVQSFTDPAAPRVPGVRRPGPQGVLDRSASSSRVPASTAPTAAPRPSRPRPRRRSRNPAIRPVPRPARRNPAVPTSPAARAARVELGSAQVAAGSSGTTRQHRLEQGRGRVGLIRHRTAVHSSPGSSTTAGARPGAQGSLVPSVAGWRLPGCRSRARHFHGCPCRPRPAGPDGSPCWSCLLLAATSFVHQHTAAAGSRPDALTRGLAPDQVAVAVQVGGEVRSSCTPAIGSTSSRQPVTNGDGGANRPRRPVRSTSLAACWC